MLLLVVAGVGGYLRWRPRPPAIPAIATAGLDAEVVAAIDEARGGIEARPQSAAAWGRLGMVLFAQDMYADCDPFFAEAERLDPRDARWPYFRGLAAILIDPTEGLALLERAARLAPDSLAVRLRLAEESLKRERIDEADALFRDLRTDYPDHPRVLLGVGQIELRRSRSQEALEPLQKAALDPTARRSARAALAEAQARLGNAAAAETERRIAAGVPADLGWADPFLAEARQFRTGLQPRLIDTITLSDNGKIDEALDLIDRVLHDHPDSAEAHLTRAKVLIRARQYDEARTELRQPSP